MYQNLNLLLLLIRKKGSFAIRNDIIECIDFSLTSDLLLACLDVLLKNIRKQNFFFLPGPPTSVYFIQRELKYKLYLRNLSALMLSRV